MKLPPKCRGIRAGNGDQEDEHNEFHEGLDESPEPTHGSFTTCDKPWAAVTLLSDDFE